MADPLPADLARALQDAESRLGAFRRVEYVTTVSSTNDIAIARAQAGAPHGTATLADVQLSGRGRRGRSWFSPPGAGVYLSAIVRPSGNAWTPGLLTLAAGVAAAESITIASGLPVELKWPNDVVIGRPWRKLAGVLSEAVGTGSRIDAVVVGIGINLQPAAYPPEIADRATSVESESGRAVDRPTVIVELLAGLSRLTRMIERGEHAGILATWRALGRAALGGAPIRWLDQTGERRGRARDLSEDGALLVESAGRLERVVGGEVTWERLSRE